MKPTPCTLLITLTGRDRPGVTSKLFTGLAEFPIAVLDVEQVVIRGHLVLGVLISCADSDGSQVEPAVQVIAAELGLTAEVTVGTGDNAPRPHGRLHVTMLGEPLLPVQVSAMADRIAAQGANIDRIHRLSRRPATAIEFDVSGADPDRLRVALAAVATEQRVDVAVQRSGLHRRAKRLVVMDVDSTLIQGEVIELLAARAGCAEEITRITEAAMRGELDFTESLHRRVAALQGLDAAVLLDVRERLVLAPGARTLVRTLKRLDYEFAIVSGGFTQVTDELVRLLDIDYSAANTLEIVNGKLTGRLTGPIVDRPGKALALERFARQAGVALSQTVAIGDGANDLDMISAAGLGIAFNAKPVLREAADTSVSVPYMDAVLYLLGISRAEVEAADAEDMERASLAVGHR